MSKWKLGFKPDWHDFDKYEVRYSPLGWWYREKDLTYDNITQKYTHDDKETSNLDDIFVQNVINEVLFARKKFPSSNLALAALTEEVGELAQAMLKERATRGMTENRVWKNNIWLEAVQVAAMAQRIAVEGDSSFDTQYYDPMFKGGASVG